LESRCSYAAPAFQKFLTTHGATGNTKLILEFEGFPELYACNVSGQELAIEGDRPFHLLRGLIHKLQAEMPQTQVEQPLHIFRACLGGAVKHGVAASGIGLEDVVGVGAIAQFHFMGFARPPAVGEVRSLREEGAEDAMFHVEHWHVLVDGDFQPCRGATPQ